MTRKRLLQFIVAALALLVVAGGSHAALDPGDHEFSLTYKQLRRSYLVYVPPQAVAGKSLLAVLNFHGGGGNAKNQKSYSRMNEAAAREGFIVIYPMAPMASATGSSPGTRGPAVTRSQHLSRAAAGVGTDRRQAWRKAPL